jgi:hypothetical protein
LELLELLLLELLELLESLDDDEDEDEDEDTVQNVFVHIMNEGIREKISKRKAWSLAFKMPSPLKSTCIF